MSLHTIKYAYHGACLAHNEIVISMQQTTNVLSKPTKLLSNRNETGLIQSFNEGMHGILVE